VIPRIEEITKAMFVNRFASPSELMSMSYREIDWFAETLIEHAKSLPKLTAG
jgi:hypothetical protein